MSDTYTEGVRVRVEPEYLDTHSEPALGHWMHIYHVTVTNEGGLPVQLISRHWVVTNSNGEEQHVRGPGVVGQQPVLTEGESFRYTSGCPLDTPVGTMHGSYRMVRSDGYRFDAEISPFTLAEPYSIN